MEGRVSTRSRAHPWWGPRDTITTVEDEVRVGRFRKTVFKRVDERGYRHWTWEMVFDPTAAPSTEWHTIYKDMI